MAEFRPLHDRVLVKRIEAEEKTPAGIIIPDTQKKNQSRAKYWPLGLERGAKMASFALSMSRSATACSLPNGPARKSFSTARTG